MNYWQEGIYSWGHFITIALVLIGFYFLLKLIIRIGLNVGVVGNSQGRIVNILRHALIVFEPLALIVLIGVFVMISPMVHGTIMALILLSNISLIRNYFMGRMILLDGEIKVGTPIKSGELKGTVIGMDRAGLRIRTIDGTYFLNYQYLIQDGYLISNVDQIGGNYLMSIKDNRKEVKKEFKNELYHILRGSPFIEPERTIKFDMSDEDDLVRVSLAIRDKEHVNDLLDHLSDRGFTAQIINK